MIKAIIIDDEKHCIESLEIDLANNCPLIELADTCQSAKDGLQSIKTNKPDLVFLDVEMPGMSGFEMLELLDTINFNIIFTTAYDQFAAKAFRISAVDYLLKPIDKADLIAAVLKVEQKMKTIQIPDNINNLLKNLQQPQTEQKIALPHRDGFEFIKLSDIIFCEADGAYTKIFIDADRKMLVSKSLGDVMDMLPPEYFQRIHHSNIINLQYVTQFIKSDGGAVILKSGIRLPVSKAKKDALLKRLGLKDG